MKRCFFKNLGNYQHLKCDSTYYTLFYVFSFFPVALKSNSGLNCLSSSSLNHTQTHTPDRNPLKERSAGRRSCCHHNTRQKQKNKTKIHALSEIRNRILSNQTAADLRLSMATGISITFLANIILKNLIF